MPVLTSENEKLYINSSGLNLFQDDDLFVWTIIEYQRPIKMEEINTLVYKTKNYLLINKVLKRYSLLQVILYDEENNVLKNFRYDRNEENINLKYSTPILPGSDIEKVLDKCLELIAGSGKEN